MDLYPLRRTGTNQLSFMSCPQIEGCVREISRLEPDPPATREDGQQQGQNQDTLLAVARVP